MLSSRDSRARSATLKPWRARNKHRNRFVRANCPPRARQSPSLHNRVERPRQGRIADVSTKPAPSRCRQKRLSRAQAVAQSAEACRIHQETTARHVFVFAMLIVKLKALRRTARTACPSYVAESPVQ